ALPILDVQGADGTPAQLDRRAGGGADLDVAEQQADLAPVRFGAGVTHHRGARWEKATWQGPWPSSSWLSSASWLSWSVALTQRSWPCSSASITPAPLAPNSNSAASTTCCKVAARSCWGCASARLLMLATSALASIRMRLSSPWPETIAAAVSLPVSHVYRRLCFDRQLAGLPGGLPAEAPHGGGQPPGLCHSSASTW